MRQLQAKFTGVLNNRKFFRFILIIFFIEAIWIAFSAAYPQAFDENFHFGLIKIYSHYWFPFFNSQPAGANTFGAVARDPSYLYHYLMSFPYRLIALFVHSQTIQVILLRIFDIGLFASGLVLFRRILLRVGISQALSNVILLIFMLIPVVPQLAAQVNYDDLLFPLVAYSCLLTFDITDQLKKHKPSVGAIMTLIILCILTSLVKYEFMPIALGIGIFLIYVTWKYYRHSLSKFKTNILLSWQKLSKLAKIIIVGLFVISMGMFIQRDVVNLVEYHSITPNCSSILSVKACSAYSAWDYNYSQHTILKNSANTIKFYNPIKYLGEWIYWMWYRLFFAVSGPNNFVNYPPLPLPSAAAAIIFVFSILMIIKWSKRIFKGDPYVLFLLIVCTIYILTLIAEGYSTYRYTDVLENMNGRYLLPILILFAAIAGKAFSVGFKKKPMRKVLLSIFALVFFFQGGGVLTFIARSDSSWDFDNKTVVKVNDVARKITNPVLINGKKTYPSTLWFYNEAF